MIYDLTYIIRQYFRRATRIAQSKALPTTADESASLLRDDSQGEAFPTVTSLDAGQDRENIIKTSALPHESTPRVTSLDADEGSMQQKLQELMDFCTDLQRQQTEMASKIKAQDLEIYNLKARIKLLEDKDRGNAEPSSDDAPIIGRSMEIGEEVGVKRNVSVPPIAGVSTVGVPTVSATFTTASVEYEQAASDLSIGEKIDLINELRYDIRGNQREVYPCLKQFEDFVPMASKEEGERVKRKGLKLEQRSAKKIKTYEEVSEEDLKEMMQLVHMEEVYVEALQVKHPIIDWEIHSEGKKDYWKIIRLGGHTAVYQFLVDMLK
nr:hypothetical protein [Tanacetum cinerariifolium]